MRLTAVFCIALLVGGLAGGFLAEELKPGEKGNIKGAKKGEASDLSLFPAKVRSYEEDGLFWIEKTYYLSKAEDPRAISTESFERGGQSYRFLELLEEEQRRTETKEHIETVTLESQTKDLAVILKKLKPQLEILTEDGYSGVLTPDYPGIRIEEAGYQTSSRKIQTTRTYPNLSGADVALLPKTVEEEGRTLSLDTLRWQEEPQKGGEASRYTAIASYTGTSVSKYATGYLVTVDYKGEVTKTDGDTIVYTAVFSADPPGLRRWLIPSGLLVFLSLAVWKSKGIRQERAQEVI